MNPRRTSRGWATIALSAALAALSLGSLAQVAPPGRVSFQGMAKDSTGNLLSGPVTMTFRFYDAASLGVLLWEEIYDPSVYPPQVTVSAGLFGVALGDPAHRHGGSETAFQGVFANHGAVYLGVSVATDPEMTPRIQVASSPFALNSDALSGKHSADFANASHTHSGTEVTSAVADATHAASADNATNATNAANATHATTADSATSATNATNATNADTLDSQHAAYFLNASSSAQTKAGGLVLNNAGDYGIDSSGTKAGGYFKDSDGTGFAYVGFGDTGISAGGTSLGGFFASNGLASYAYVAHGDRGIEAYGVEMGGYFKSNAYGDSGYAHVGFGDYGIQAFGNNMGGYFTDLTTNSYADVGYSVYGIKAVGSTTGGFFANAASGYANVGYGDYGIQAWGSYAGGHFDDSNDSSWADVSYSTYKIYGSGAVSFVQDHPIEKDKVIVYACPEGDEVATYTRGTARLVNGEARVSLGETFQWVTNPDLGLTAHLTARGKAVPLAVTSLSTTELVVTGSEDVAFDYLVYGLRIGFEESSIVQEKQRESYIPSFNDHRERYAKYPQLRAFNALERFKTMESTVRGVPESSLDLSHARALRDAIHEYDPATDPPVEKLLGHGGGRPADAPPPPLAAPAQPVRSPMATASAGLSSSAPNGELAPAEAGPSAALDSGPSFPCMPVSETVEPGDVVVMDPVNDKHVVRCVLPVDPLVVGVAVGRGEECKKTASEEASSQVPVATSGIVSCRVDASFGPIHRGDLLVASPNPGHAMRAVDSTPGTVLGKALEPLDKGTSTIRVLVMLR